MPAPAQFTYSLAAIVAANTSFLDLIDIQTGPALVRVYSESDVLLAQPQMTDPAGSVNPPTGTLTFTFSGVSPDVLVTGVAAYGQLCDATGVALLDLPAVAGVAAVSGYIVLSTLNLIAGEPLTISSATIG